MAGLLILPCAWLEELSREELLARVRSQDARLQEQDAQLREQAVLLEEQDGSPPTRWAVRSGT